MIEEGDDDNRGTGIEGIAICAVYASISTITQELELELQIRRT